MCLVIDADAAEHGEDNYTPLIAEQLGLEEFLLVQDILMVRDYVAGCGVDPNERSLTFATKFYFERDAIRAKPNWPSTAKAHRGRRALC